jgi:hypothetical protein
VRLQWKVLISLSVLLNCIFLVPLVVAFLSQHQTRYPPADLTSAFLRNYTPKPVIDSFASSEYSSEWGESKGWSAGSNLNEREIRPGFTIQSEDQFLLMTAVKDDINDELAKYGATVLSQSGDLQSGFLFKYKLGANRGSIDLSPLTTNSGIHRNTPLPDGIADVRFSVKIAEKPE